MSTPATINAGTLALTGAGSLNSTNVAVNGSTFDVSGVTAGTTSIGSLAGDANGIVTLGATTLRLSAAAGTFPRRDWRHRRSRGRRGH